MIIPGGLITFEDATCERYARYLQRDFDGGLVQAVALEKGRRTEEW